VCRSIADGDDQIAGVVMVLGFDGVAAERLVELGSIEQLVAAICETFDAGLIRNVCHRAPLGPS
jgi:hypothetical protein